MDDKQVVQLGGTVRPQDVSAFGIRHPDSEMGADRHRVVSHARKPFLLKGRGQPGHLIVGSRCGFQ